MIQPLPLITARAARQIFGKGNPYLTIGDQLEIILTSFDSFVLQQFPGQTTIQPIHLSLITYFQYLEGLADREAVEAIRLRLDWKYALHMPLDIPRLDSNVLCEHRRHLLQDTKACESFDHLIKTLAGYGLRGEISQKNSVAQEVVHSVCNLTRLDQIVQAFYSTLETLASTRTEWLRKIARPYWFSRYMSSIDAREIPQSQLRQISFAETLGVDAYYLLREAEGLGENELKVIPELISLRRIVAEQFVIQNEELKWRPKLCASCRSSRVYPIIEDISSLG